MEAKLKELVLQATNNIDLYKAPRDAIEELYKNPCTQKKCYRNLNVAVVVAPCHGFGDVIFATKFARYLKKGLTPNSQLYSHKVTIITPTPAMFEKLNVVGIPIVSLKGNIKQCRRLRNYNRPPGLGTLDLIFIAPLPIGFSIIYSDVRSLFKESTPFNTIFLSEYQAALSKPAQVTKYDIPTGIGDDYMGLLFDGTKPPPKLKIIDSTPYALAYLARDVGIPYCLSNFVKMIVEKYHKKFPRLQIVMPLWGVKQLLTNIALKRFIHRYYPNVIVKTKEVKKQLYTSAKSGTLTIRGDILSVSRPDMLSLIKYSIPDILVTGDQSITDVIDCCQMKTIWYQTVPWKSQFAKELSIGLSNEYLYKATTSCGTLKAIQWKAKKTTFKADNDFRKKAKHLLDVIFRAASDARRPNTIVAKYLAQLKKSKSKKLLLKIL